MPLDHDTATTINLISSADRLVEDGVDTASSVAHLRGIAGSRADLLELAAQHYRALDTARSAACGRLLSKALANHCNAAVPAKQVP